VTPDGDVFQIAAGLVWLGQRPATRSAAPDMAALSRQQAMRSSDSPSKRCMASSSTSAFTTALLVVFV
jgi:hypothetical protein